MSDDKNYFLNFCENPYPARRQQQEGCISNGSSLSFKIVNQVPSLCGVLMLLSRGPEKIASPDSCIYFRCFELIPVEEIISCEASDNYTFFYLKSKKKITACRMLKEVEEQLNDYGYFVRTHHSYLTNIKEATKYVKGEGGSVIMSNGSSIAVSRSRKESLLQRFGNKRF